MLENALIMNPPKSVPALLHAVSYAYTNYPKIGRMDGKVLTCRHHVRKLHCVG
jgi:hypothetical protein